MPFLLLLFLTLACLPDSWPEIPGWIGSPTRSALVTSLAMSLGPLAAWWISWRVRQRLAHEESRRDQVFRRYQSWRFYHLLGLFALYLASLYLLGWGSTVLSICAPTPEAPVHPLVFATELIILAPFLFALVLSWVFFYDAESAFHDSIDEEASPAWSRWGYVGYHVRQNLALVMVPLLLLILQKSLRKLFPNAEEEWQYVLVIAGGLLALSFIIGMPWILRLVWRLKPLPAGLLRTRLEAVAARLNFRCSNILLWNTRGGAANAMVAGVLPAPRYVLLTDRLIADLTSEEIEAVFGHEIGHVKHRHMLYYLSFLLLSLGVLWSVVALFLPDTRDDLVAVPLMVSALGAYIFLVFGFLSRRCERQADIYGCRAVSCKGTNCLCHTEEVELAPAGEGLCPTGIRIFIDALEKVGFLNGISRDRPGFFQSWQHSTIARRVEFLQRMLKDPSLEKKFQRRVGLVKWALLVGLGIGLAVLMFVHS